MKHFERRDTEKVFLLFLFLRVWLREYRGRVWVENFRWRGGVEEVLMKGFGWRGITLKGDG